MFTPNQSVRNQGFSAMTTAVVAAVVIGVGAGAVYVSTQNKMTAEKTATSTATTTQEADDTSTTTSDDQAGPDRMTVTGSVTKIDKSAMAVDGPAKIIINSDSGETQTVRIPARAQQCSQSADVISLDSISVGDQVSVRGSLHADSIAPCRLPDGFMRKEASSQESGDEQSAVKTTLTDTFRDQKFTATVHKEGENIWRYKVSGSLPNPCWNYTVEAGPISPVAGNQQQTYRIDVAATPPEGRGGCGPVVQSVEESGQIQDSTSDVKFELNVDEAGEIPDLPS
jgi:hypothetical protein